VRCDVLGLLSRLIYIDMVDVAEEEARQRLLDGVRPGRAKRKAEYPGTARHTQTQQPVFPGEPTSSVLSATRERPLAVAAEQPFRLVRSVAEVDPARRIRRPSPGGSHRQPDAASTPLHAFLSARRMSFPKRPAIWAGAVAAAGALAIFVAVAQQPSGPKANKVMVEIFPIGGTFNVYREGRFLQRIGPDLPPLYIAATEGETFTIECRTNNLNVTPPFLITAGPGMKHSCQKLN
jgi:hypothetical protein